MSYVNQDVTTIDWREYLKYERLRRQGHSMEYIDIGNPMKRIYEEIFLEFLNRTLYGNA